MIFSETVESINKPGMDRGVSRYTSITRLLMLYMEKSESLVCFAIRRAGLNVWLDILGAIMAFDIAENEELYVPVTGSRFLLTGRESSEQTAHNDFKV